MSSMYERCCKVMPAVANRATTLGIVNSEGCYVYTEDGHKVLDFASGVAVNNLGAKNPEVVEAIKEQLDTMIHVGHNVVYNESYVALAEKLVALTGGDTKVYFSNSGAEANDGAMKLAKYVTKRPGVIAFRNSFHGRTIGSLSVTGSSSAYRKYYEPLMPSVYWAEYANCHRCPFGKEEGCCKMECLKQFDAIFAKQIAPECVAAIIVEPVQGEGGYIPPKPEFLKGLREICDKHGIMLIFDEVQTGIGRTGELYAFQTFGVKPDILTSAKALGGGIPLSAIIAKAEIMDALNQKAELAARRQRYETMLEQADVRRAEVTQKLLKFKSDESVQEEQKKEEEAKFGKVRECLEAFSAQEKELQEQTRTEEEQERRLNQKLSSLQQDYHTSRTKLESMRNLAERYEGYGGSIRRVMEVRDRVPGIHGVVADLISTTKKYETAIETALGGSIQNIVTDSEETAKRLIEHLKKNRYGRATFLPLTSMERRQSFGQPGALKETGVLGLASELVSADEKYSGLVSYLLGRVVVVDQIDHAIALQRKYHHMLRIVTLEGESLNPGGSMTGGSFRNSSSLLSRNREIEELREKYLI